VQYCVLMQDLRNEFPALNKQVYFNSASSGLLSKSLLDWRRAHDVDYYNNGVDFVQRKEIPEYARGSVARLFDAKLSETALVPNLSFGINIVLDGLSKGQKVLLLREDYPSLRWPVETRDLDVCYAKIDEHLEDNVLQAVEKHKPDIFMFSIVQWLSGIKIDFEFLKQLKFKYPNMLLVADGTQYMGTEHFSFKDNAIDVLGASAYKWLCAGFGNGFMLIKEDVQDRISPKTIGFNSADTFDSKPTDTRFIKYFEPGHQDSLAFGSLDQAIKKVEQIGIQHISKAIKSHTHHAIEGLIEKGLLPNASKSRKGHSSIVNFTGNRELFKKLATNNIICSLRGGGIRVSFHYYNTIAEVDTLLKLL
jgi:selenocysteine lyase/cysteine desulfurase